MTFPGFLDQFLLLIITELSKKIDENTDKILFS